MFQVHILDLNVHFGFSIAYNWTSMSISGGPAAYYWISMSILNCRNSLRGVGGRQALAAALAGEGAGGDVPTTLDFWRSPVPTCPGTKCPVWGIPHFDKTVSVDLVCGEAKFTFW